MNAATLAGQLLPAAEGEYFLRAKRKAPLNGEAIRFDARWTTNLTTVDIRSLKCFTQEDDTGDDTIQMFLQIDGSIVYSLYWGDFDTGQTKHDALSSVLGPLHSINIASAIVIEVYELDADNDPDFLGQSEITSGQPNEENAKLGIWYADRNFTQDEASYQLGYSKSW
jgi:hypothetical protein